MNAINLRQNLINSINILPSDMLEEMYKFLSFLEYKNSYSSKSQNQIDILNEFEDSIKDIKRVKNCNDKSILYNGSLDDMIKELK